MQQPCISLAEKYVQALTLPLMLERISGTCGKRSQAFKAYSPDALQYEKEETAYYMGVLGRTHAVIIDSPKCCWGSSHTHILEEE